MRVRSVWPATARPMLPRPPRGSPGNSERRKAPTTMNDVVLVRVAVAVVSVAGDLAPVVVPVVVLVVVAVAVLATFASFVTSVVVFGLSGIVVENSSLDKNHCVELLLVVESLRGCLV